MSALPQESGTRLLWEDRLLPHPHCPNANHTLSHHLPLGREHSGLRISRPRLLCFPTAIRTRQARVMPITMNSRTKPSASPPRPSSRKPLITTIILTGRVPLLLIYSPPPRLSLHHLAHGHNLPMVPLPSRVLPLPRRPALSHHVCGLILRTDLGQAPLMLGRVRVV